MAARYTHRLCRSNRSPAFVAARTAASGSAATMIVRAAVACCRSTVRLDGRGGGWRHARAPRSPVATHRISWASAASTFARLGCHRPRRPRGAQSGHRVGRPPGRRCGHRRCPHSRWCSADSWQRYPAVRSRARRTSWAPAARETPRPMSTMSPPAAPRRPVKLAASLCARTSPISQPDQPARPGDDPSGLTTRPDPAPRRCTSSCT
jgi:hypothetical protein